MLHWTIWGREPGVHEASLRRYGSKLDYHITVYFLFILVTESSYSNLSGRFTYVTAHSPTLPPLYLRHSSFSNPSVASPTSQLILQPFRRFTYVTAHSPTLPPFYLRHSSFSNSSVASPTSQLILQPVRCFTYVTIHSPTLLSLLLRHKLFT